MKDETDALTQYQNAAKALQNYDSKGVALFWDACSKMSTKHCLLAEALKVYRMVVKMHMDAGRFNQAAKDWKEIAQMEEKEGQLKAAMDAWEQAGKCYDAENAKA